MFCKTKIPAIKEFVPVSIFFAVFFSIVLPVCAMDFSFEQLPPVWKFATDEEDKGVAEEWYCHNYDDIQWREALSKGEGWNSQGLEDEYVGVGWYRQSFVVPDFAGEKEYVYLFFEAVDENAWVYLDGRLIKEHSTQTTGLSPGEIWRKSFAAEIGEHISPGQKTQLAVRVLNSAGDGGVYLPVWILGSEVEIAAENMMSHIEWGNEEVFVYSRPMEGTFLLGERLMFNQGEYISPELSPCGDIVLFNSSAGGVKGVWVINLESREKRRICDGEEAKWSPEGDRIIHVDEGRIMEAYLPGGEKTLVSPEGWDECRFPVYGPGGEIYFVRGRKLYEAEGGSAFPVLEGEIESPPAVSPCGGEMAFQDGSHIYGYDLMGGRRRQITYGPGAQSWPVWSRDGASIAYLQRQDPFSMEGDIFQKKAGAAGKGRIEREVHGGFDWFGSHPSAMREFNLKGTDMLFWKGADSAGADGNGMLSGEGRKEMPEGIIRRERLLIGNELGFLDISIKGNSISYIHGTKEARKVTGIILENDGGFQLGHIDRLEILESNPDEVLMKLSGRGEDTRWYARSRMEVFIRMPAGRPLVEMIPGRNTKRLILKSEFDYVVAPDRLSNDTIVNSAKLTCEGPLFLHAANLVLGLGGEGESMVILVAPCGTQRTALEVKDGKHFLKAGFSKKPLAFAGIAGEDIWTEAKFEKKGDNLKVYWSEPYWAAWRASVISHGAIYSVMLGEEELEGIREGFFKIGGFETDDPEKALIYLFKSSFNSPLEVISPKDVVLTYLGIDGAAGFLNTYNVRGFQCPAETPFLELADVLKVFDTGAAFRGALLQPSGTAGVKQLKKNYCGDALRLLEGVDARIREYDFFLKRMEKNALAGHGGSTEEMKSPVASLLMRLIENTEKEQVTCVDEVSVVAAELIKSYNSNDSWRLREEFRELAMEALEERKNILSEYRSFAMSLRDELKVKYMMHPENYGNFYSLIDETGDVLSCRNYMEGDWRGEKPLYKGFEIKR